MGVKGRNFQRQYKDKLSDYHSWKQGIHAEHQKNLGPYLSIDETALSNGERYNMITNKARKGQNGAIVGMFIGTQSTNSYIKITQVTSVR
ncbi:hypothetical protein [Carboxylicivirga sp. M1479]|uniref:hypothetical protein n=1 Tax=Carboxylicivirga sp. M1479 TaxID=2594476 RepID=UPI002107FD2D|nr:hypothetical protein [Carboxylicivirga sp. M1479]